MCEIDHIHNQTLAHFHACLPCMIPSSDCWRDIQNLWLLTALEAASAGSSQSTGLHRPVRSRTSAIVLCRGLLCCAPARLIYVSLSHLPHELWILNFGCCCVVALSVHFGSWTLDAVVLSVLLLYTLELWMLFCCGRSALICIERTFCSCQPPPFLMGATLI